MSRPLVILALLLAGLAVARLSSPARTAAFVLSGEHLDLGQRDVRAANTFTDASANDNLVAQPEFPGTLGAALAVRKAHVEWSSEAWAGTGAGDGSPSNAVLGSGGANFDNSWQGVTSGPTGTNDNVHVALPLSSGSTLAYVEFPVSDGWRVVYYDQPWVWSDGPGAPGPGEIDLQGLATRMAGFTLGLASTSVANQTMSSTATDLVLLRSIEFDDVAGIQAIYGMRSPAKPRITGLSGSRATGGVLVIEGQGFGPAGNEVWFTRAAATGEPLKLLNVASFADSVSVAIPDGAADGDVLVRLGAGTSGASLSNAFPFDLADGFTELHPGLGAAGAPPPWLTGEGTLAPGGAGFGVLLAGAPASAPGALFVALQVGAAPFKGGTLYALPVALTLAVTSDAAGTLALGAVMPVGTPPGTLVVLQAALAEAAAPNGVVLSNGLLLEVP
jgi:hypothetical protein